MNKHVSTRRVFLTKGLTLLAVAPTVPAFLDQSVLAMADPLDVTRTQRASGKDGKILVVVQLSGGNDGLNTVIPHGDHEYRRARPQLGHDAKSVLKIDDYLGLHPSLGGLKKLFDDGRMGIVQGVGYPNPNRSHFRSMDIWQSAEPEREAPGSGWLGRYFDNTCKGNDPHVGVAIGQTLPLAMLGERVRPLSFERPETYRYNGKDAERFAALNRVADRGSKIEERKTGAAGELDFLHRTAMDAQLSSDEILGMTRRYRPEGNYPFGEFGGALRTVAAMIAGGLPTRVYYLSQGGYDTHAGERGRHDQLMSQLAQGVGAFWDDLKRQGNADRVMMMTFSEFGRRVEQNASGGTDHGAAAPMFLFGNHVKQGVIGKHPSLTDLDQGDLRYAIDFRSVYAAVLQNWLEAPGGEILGKQFTPVPVVKA